MSEQSRARLCFREAWTMPYRYLPDVATADVAFEAWGDSLEELFRSAADATMNAMVEDLDTVAANETRMLELENSDIDLLLFQLLQELIFYKDADRLLLRIHGIEIHPQEGGYGLRAQAMGETIDATRHDLSVDVKAVTLHRFRVERTARGWEATVVLDI
jgi:SHS2 domain-containing protein